MICCLVRHLTHCWCSLPLHYHLSVSKEKTPPYCARYAVCSRKSDQSLFLFSGIKRRGIFIALFGSRAEDPAVRWIEETRETLLSMINRKLCENDSSKWAHLKRCVPSPPVLAGWMFHRCCGYGRAYTTEAQGAINTDVWEWQQQTPSSWAVVFYPTQLSVRSHFIYLLPYCCAVTSHHRELFGNLSILMQAATVHWLHTQKKWKSLKGHSCKMCFFIEL